MRFATPAAPGREARRSNEHKRCGTANVFCVVEPKAGRHFAFATPDRSGFEFARVAVTLAMAYRDAQTIHPVMDNLNINRRKALADVFDPEVAAESGIASPSITRPLTGVSSTRLRSKSGSSHGSVWALADSPLKVLRQEARAWNRRMNRDRVKINSTFDRRPAQVPLQKTIFHAVVGLAGGNV